MKTVLAYLVLVLGSFAFSTGEEVAKNTSSTTETTTTLSTVKQEASLKLAPVYRTMEGPQRPCYSC